MKPFHQPKPPLNKTARKIWDILWSNQTLGEKETSIESLFTFRNTFQYKYYRFKYFIWQLKSKWVNRHHKE